MTTSVFWGSVAALAWGLSYLWLRQPTRRMGSAAVLLISTLIGLAWMTPYLLLTGELAALLTEDNASAWWWAVLATSLNAFASLLLFRAIEIGHLSVATAISSSYAGFVVLVSVAAGERLRPVEVAGIALVLLGVVCSVPGVKKRLDNIAPSAARAGALLSFVASFMFGVGYWMLGAHVAPTLGGVVPVWVGRLTTLPLLLPWLLRLRAPVSLQADPLTWAMLVASTLLGNAAFIASNLGYQTGDIAVVSVLASLYSPITVVLAWAFLREPLSRRQVAGVLLLMVGVVMLNAG